jgi:Na+/H+-dicarboxylate symporter
MKKPGLTGCIIIAMTGGITTGLLIHFTAGEYWAVRFSESMSVVTDIFLRLIKMIIAPLVFSTLVTGIAKMGDTKAVGRIGAKTIAWFLGASLISLLLGLVIMNLVDLGNNLKLPLPDVSEAGNLENGNLNFKTFITHVFPRSFAEAMANNEILQIVVFAIFFGIATAAIGEKGKIFIRALDSLTEIILKVTAYIMHFAPIAAFAAVSAILSLKGPEILFTYGKFIGLFYVSILLLWLLLTAISYL